MKFSCPRYSLKINEFVFFIKVFYISCGTLLFCNGQEIPTIAFTLLEMKIVLNAVRAYKNPRFYFFDKALSCLAKVLYSKKNPIILSKKLQLLQK